MAPEQSEEVKTRDEREQENKDVAQEVREDSRRSDAGDDVPFADPKTDPDKAREPQVGEPVETSFDERTGVQQPWLHEDGTQDNGAENLAEQEGASRQSTREGDQTTVEDTKDAADKGLVPESDQPDVDEEPAKNPTE